MRSGGVSSAVRLLRRKSVGFGLLSEAAWFAPKNRQRKSSPLPWQPLFLTSRHLYIYCVNVVGCPPTQRTTTLLVSGGLKVF